MVVIGINESLHSNCEKKRFKEYEIEKHCLKKYTSIYLMPSSLANIYKDDLLFQMKSFYILQL